MKKGKTLSVERSLPNLLQFASCRRRESDNKSGACYRFISDAERESATSKW